MSQFADMIIKIARLLIFHFNSTLYDHRMSFAELFFMHCASIRLWSLRALITPEKWSPTLRVFLGILDFSERKQDLRKHLRKHIFS
jgi:hypothetical protein